MKQQSPIKKVWKWLLIVLLCSIIVFVLGVIAGDVVLGHATLSDVFDISTWKHLIRLME